jgi:hypothetical protein
MVEIEIEVGHYWNQPNICTLPNSVIESKSPIKK